MRLIAILLLLAGCESDGEVDGYGAYPGCLSGVIIGYRLTTHLTTEPLVKLACSDVNPIIKDADSD